MAQPPRKNWPVRLCLIKKYSKYLESGQRVVDKEKSTKSVGNFRHMLGDNVAMAMSHVLRELYVHLQILPVNITVHMSPE